MSIKNSNDTIGNQTRELPSCSADSNVCVTNWTIMQTRDSSVQARSNNKIQFFVQYLFFKPAEPYQNQEKFEISKQSVISLVFTLGNLGDIHYVTCYRSLVFYNSKSATEVTRTYRLTQNIGMKDEAVHPRFDPGEQASLRCNGFF